MNDRQLKTFIKAADCKSFSKAARESYISVPALVQQVDLLEESVGFELFIRSTRGIRLTPGGQTFYKAAKEILRIYDDAVFYGKKENSSEIRIAAAPEQTPDFLFRSISRFSRQYPDVKISLVSCPYNDQLNELRKYAVDCAVMAEPDPAYLKDLTFYPLCRDTCAFAMNTLHPLAQKELLTREDLKDMSIICGSYFYLKNPFTKILSGCRAHLKEASQEYGLDLRTQSLLSEDMLVIHALWADAHRPILKVVPSDIDAGNIGIVYRTRSAEAMKNFIEFLSV